MPICADDVLNDMEQHLHTVIPAYAGIKKVQPGANTAVSQRIGNAPQA